MKANLSQNEPKILARWEEMRLYDRIREAKAGTPAYVLHDGPPYANGPIHLGHALNKCLKDFVVKSKSMAGFDAPYIPGWDCHGLPIEIKVDQQLGGKKLQMKPLDVRLECRKYAQYYLDQQREQFKRIGVLGRFDKPYSTTTPWTLPASMAVAFHPSEEYVALEAADAIYIVAEKLAKSVAEKCGFPDAKTIARFPGRAMEHTWFYHPFLPWERRKILGVVADYVTMDTGTGVVHTAPSHGAEDFATGQRYKLDLTCDVDAAGVIHNGLPEYDGLKVLKANQPIIELLTSRGVLLHSESVEHQYPHCWRCHNPVIFRATEQWFISMETKFQAQHRLDAAPTGDATLRSRALEEIKKVKWDPAWGEERISNMVETRPDWCISRQRVWGVPIPIFFCESCNQPLRSKATDEAVIALFAREGADAWYTRDAKELIPAEVKCGGCEGQKFRQEFDIIDVWFESGSSWAAVMGELISDLYIEGGDQHRGWFQ